MVVLTCIRVLAGWHNLSALDMVRIHSKRIYYFYSVEEKGPDIGTAVIPISELQQSFHTVSVPASEKKQGI